MNSTDSQRLAVLKTHKLFIGGQFPRSESGRSYPLIKPGAKRPYAQLCLGSRKDLRAAVEAAKDAQPGWAARSAYNRGQILYRMAEMLESRADSWQSLLRNGLGLTAAQAGRALAGSIDALVYFAGAADKYPQVAGAVNPVAGPYHNFTTPEAVGVVALLSATRYSIFSSRSTRENAYTPAPAVARRSYWAPSARAGLSARSFARPVMDV